MKEKIVSITAISGIVILEVIALYKGINGVMLATTIGVIAGIAGYSIKNHLDKNS